MSRAFCYQCRRARVACLCGRIEKQPNDIRIIVLQHPDEVNNSKGTGVIAELGLQKYQKWVSDDFAQHKELTGFIAENAEKTAILYPLQGADELTEESGMAETLNIENLIVIDGTWRKAKKIWELQPLLGKLQCLRLTNAQISNYRIRKVPGDGYLSTIESVVFALRALEGRRQAYQPLLDLFTEMVDYQITQMGEETYFKNYADKTNKK